jgi:hypothetical protein
MPSWDVELNKNRLLALLTLNADGTRVRLWLLTPIFHLLEVNSERSTSATQLPMMVSKLHSHTVLKKPTLTLALLRDVSGLLVK